MYPILLALTAACVCTTNAAGHERRGQEQVIPIRVPQHGDTLDRYLNYRQRPQKQWYFVNPNQAPVREVDISAERQLFSPETLNLAVWPRNYLARANASSSSEEIVLESVDDVSLEHEKHPTKAWQAPPYKQAQIDYDNAITEFNRHESSYGPQSQADLNYIVITNVISRLASNVAQNGWYLYNSDFSQLSQMYIKEALSEPQAVLKDIQCRIKEVVQYSRKITQIIKSDTVTYLCEAQPSSCDAAIHAIVKLNRGNFNHAADVHLAIGEATSTFLATYAKVFDTVSQIGHRVSFWIQQHKEYFRELVGKLATLIWKANPRGLRGCSTRNTIRRQ